MMELILVIGFIFIDVCIKHLSRTNQSENPDYPYKPADSKHTDEWNRRNKVNPMSF